MDRITRKGLKQDKFALEVGHTVEYLGMHRKQAIRIGIAVGVVAVLVLAILTYRGYSYRQRQAALSAALEIQMAPVSPTPNDVVRTFPTEQERTKAAVKAFADVATRFAGSGEATIATYYLGILAADDGRLPDAEKALKEVIESGNDRYAALGRLALADVYKGMGKMAEAEKVLRSLMEKPSAFVSKEQATIELAQLLGPTRPAEARKLLEPLRTERGTISRSVLTALSELPRQ